MTPKELADKQERALPYLEKAIDPQALAELADGLRWMFEAEQMNYDFLRPAATSLDELARIKAAALPETLEALAAERRRTQVLIDYGVKDLDTPIHRGIATLLDALRAKEAELAGANEVNKQLCADSIADVQRVVAERDAARDEADRQAANGLEALRLAGARQREIERLSLELSKYERQAQP